jgi:hypothetical protein
MALTCGPLVDEGIICPLVNDFDLWTISSRGYHLPINQWLGNDNPPAKTFIHLSSMLFYSFIIVLLFLLESYMYDELGPVVIV